MRLSTQNPNVMMTRRQLLSLVALPVTGTNVPGQGTGFHLKGTISGEHTEGGYFHIGNDFVMATPIRSPLYEPLNALVGYEVELTIHPVHG